MTDTVDKSARPTYDYVASCEFEGFVNEDDGEFVVSMAESGVMSWIEETGIRRGDVAVIVNGADHQPLQCAHQIDSVVPSEIADELTAAAQEHEVTMGDQIVVMRRRP